MSSREELITKFSKKANIPKRSAGDYLGILLELIKQVLIRTGTVKIPGFGSFKAKAVAERDGINPLTGEKVTFAPGVRIGFKAGKPLKEGMMKGTFIAKAKAKKAEVKKKLPKKKK
ncbi:MAG: HU family DNA-binding protein [Deltaproteobacteria bacterium]|nr:HU family DNA-binding protein [Deltaproteobacteria bacterium]